MAKKNTTATKQESTSTKQAAAKATKTSKKSAEPQQEQKAEKAKASKLVERDKWGAALTSQLARINRVICGTPMTGKQIAEKAEANLAATQSHLRTLKNKGHIEKVEGGFILKTETKAKSRKSK